jgi:hypothetical protein
VLAVRFVNGQKANEVLNLWTVQHVPAPLPDMVPDANSRGAMGQTSVGNVDLPPEAEITGAHSQPMPCASLDTTARPSRLPKTKPDRTRMLQYKWALDMEHERRFRRGMTDLMGDILAFQRSNTYVRHKLSVIYWHR